MILIVGLGNPGGTYKNTRHNIGFRIVDALSTEIGTEEFSLNKKAQALEAKGVLDSQEVELLKPQTYMNDSGKSVKHIFKKHQNLSIDDLILVHDDLDIAFGEYKIQKGKGPKDHNGVESVENALGNKDFWRVRVGIENRNSGNKMSGEEYVLAPFTSVEEEKLDYIIHQIVKETLFHALHK